MRLGVDFGGTNVKIGLFEDDATLVRHISVSTGDIIVEGTPAERLIGLAADVAGGADLDAVGIASKGLIDPERGCVVDDIGHGLALAGIDLRGAFSQAFGCPAVIENDARAFAWGEWRFGSGRGSKVMVCMTFGTGLGCAVVSHGALYYGASPLGGILGGHISIDRNGIPCICGQVGCLERYCSATAFAERIIQSHPGRFDLNKVVPQFFERVRIEPEVYGATLGAFQKDLAVGIVNVVHAYGPDRVVLGGGLMEAGDQILPEVVRLVHEAAWTMPRASVEIRASTVGAVGAALGAAFHPHLPPVTTHTTPALV
jgi:glucokinase